ncbi:MAG: hypothetical protein ACFFFB_08880 [Candidatus Heimdallarchaeota archaeon]
MTEDSSEKPHLLLREIFSEILLRDIILFAVLFLFTLAQSWDNIFLFLFPIISFAYTIFFRIISTNNWRIKGRSSSIIYNPLGLEKKHANRLVFCTLIQLILLLWIGAESLYHPQLIDDYDIYFNILFLFIYSFGFYWIISDTWKHCKIDLGDTSISFLNRKKYNQILIISLTTFIALNISNVLYALAILTNLTKGINIYLPGTGIESSGPMQITIISIFILLISPLLTTFLLIIIYRDINNFSTENLYNALKDVPENSKQQILDNLKNLNKKLEESLSRE